ncbi:TPR [Pyrrhoderma noxium]|uniref:ER membrane protein complex subunit 2 n=1 Tax=Pyrrhoderma noxium TaxID=2282107 RepID=A0A286UDY2_9AGAM|nr:TPR [Pyrrhoderma noxium]
MSFNFSKALQELASFRIKNSRRSQEVVDLGLALLANSRRKASSNSIASTSSGSSILASSGISSLEEDSAWIEQLALAAIDVGRLDIADECIEALAEKFPGSPRVVVLVGIRKEASLPAESALAYYEELLAEDETNAAAWKRKIVVLRRLGDVTKAVDELTTYLDTYYTDVEGWLELADIYATCGQFDSSLRSLQHVLLLAPQNPFYVLHAAETAYTASDVPLAAKFFLGVIDMTDDPDLDAAARVEAVPEGIAVRAWFGLKQCTRRLITDPRGSSNSPSQTTVPQHVHALDELATERLLTAYSTLSGGPHNNGPVKGRDELVKWLEAK